MKATRSVKIIGALAIVIAVVLSLSYVLQVSFEKEELRAEQKNVAQYLQEKYGQDFVIKKVEFYSDYRGDRRELIRSYVVSKDEEPIEFVVSSFVGKPDYHWESKLFLGGEIGESYRTIRLSRELGAKCKEVAEKVFSRPVSVSADMSLTSDYHDQKLGAVPAYFELVKTRPDVFLAKGTFQSVQLVFFYDLDESNKAQEAEKIFVFMNELRRLCAPGTDNQIFVDYYPPDFAQEAQKTIARIGLGEFTTIEGGYYTSREYAKSGRRQYHLLLPKKEINSIKEPADILKYFKNR